MVETAEEILVDKTRHYSYPSMTKTLGSFKLTVQEGSFTDSEIIVMLGENGTGKTTFVRLLAGEEPDEPADKQSMAVSLKPQTISPKFPGTVRMLLLKQIKAAFMHPQFQSDVVKPMNIENIIDQEVKTLSGGELQRVAIVLALGKPNVSVYLIDEPSSCVFFFWSVFGRFAPKLSEFQLLGLGAAHNYSKGHQAFHLTREEDGLCYRARFHNGDLPRRPRHCLRGRPSCRCHRHTVCFFCCPCLIYSEDLIAFMSLQTTIATYGDEQIPPIIGNNVPSRPDKFPPACEQTQFGQG